MTAASRKWLVAFALLGLAASTASTYVHYNLIRNPDYRSFCDITSTVSCTQAYLSRYGSIGGVPVAVGGVLFFGVRPAPGVGQPRARAESRTARPRTSSRRRRWRSRSCSTWPTRRSSS